MSSNVAFLNFLEPHDLDRYCLSEFMTTTTRLPFSCVLATRLLKGHCQRAGHDEFVLGHSGDTSSLRHHVPLCAVVRSVVLYAIVALALFPLSPGSPTRRGPSRPRIERWLWGK